MSARTQRPSSPAVLPAKTPAGSNSDVQLQILETLQKLLKRQQEAARQPPLLTEFLWNLLLQLFGLAIAAMFGAFAILSWQLGNGSNSLSSRANSLAADANTLAGNSNDLSSQSNCIAGVSNWVGLANYCLDAPNASFCAEFASEFQEYAETVYANIVDRATSCFASTSTTGVTATQTSGAEPGGASEGANSGQIGIIVGSIVAAIFVLGMLYLPYRTYRSKFYRKSRQPQMLQI